METRGQGQRDTEHKATGQQGHGTILNQEAQSAKSSWQLAGRVKWSNRQFVDWWIRESANWSNDFFITLPGFIVSSLLFMAPRLLRPKAGSCLIAPSVGNSADI